MRPLENCYVLASTFQQKVLKSNYVLRSLEKKKQTEVEAGCHTIRVLLSSAGEEAEAA